MVGQCGRRPDFIVIGATKAGTTSLDFYLGCHPEIYMAKPKELRFFTDYFWSQGVEWYENYFHTTKTYCGETSPQYAHWPHVPERMAAIVPRIKLIYMVREPMARLRSQYLMAARRGWSKGSFESYIDQHPYALEDSLYGKQISRFLNHFPLSSIHILETQDLKNRRDQALAKVFQFIGANTEYSSIFFRQERHVGKTEVYPNALGKRIDSSRLMKWSKRVLPMEVQHHLRNMILAPFAGVQPSTALPEAKRKSLDILFREQVEQLRSLTGQPLQSLDALPDQ